MKLWLQSLLDLLLPVYCLHCHLPLHTYEEFLCFICQQGLERVPIYHPTDNPVGAVFRGRLNLESAAALWRIQKDSPASSLVHSLKYEDRRSIGLHYGRHMSKQLSVPSSIDAVLPVPLHPRKKRERGYNQSELIAEAVAESLGIELLRDVLIRKTHTKSQTAKNRTQRWQNVSQAFALSTEVKHTHLLIVDDVVTTGATIEACAQLLIGKKISVMALGCAY